MLQITKEDVRNELRKLEKKAKQEASNAFTNAISNLNLPTSSVSVESYAASDDTETSAMTMSTESSATESSATESSASESSATAESSTVPVARNRGGRPLGSTNARKQAVKDDTAKATNQVVEEYAKIKAQKAAEGIDNVEKGTLTKLIEQAKIDFPLVGPDFTVSAQTVSARMKKGNLTVWHRGTPSPVLPVEPILTAFITQAYEMNAPWTVGQCKAAMNELIEGTPIAAKLIAQRMKEGTYYPDKPLLGVSWWRGYKKRNRQLVKTCVGRKFARNRANHVTYPAFSKMFHGIYDRM
eukprot:scaffold64512_cov38-Cyclotella_meneghiniana.AAC.1